MKSIEENCRFFNVKKAKICFASVERIDDRLKENRRILLTRGETCEMRHNVHTRRPSISMSEEIRMIQFLTRQQRVKKIIASRIIQQTV